MAGAHLEAGRVSRQRAETPIAPVTSPTGRSTSAATATFGQFLVKVPRAALGHPAGLATTLPNGAFQGPAVAPTSLPACWLDRADHRQARARRVAADRGGTGKPPILVKMQSQAARQRHLDRPQLFGLPRLVDVCAIEPSMPAKNV